MDDISRLQEEGLIPQDLRYIWRKLNRLDFSKHILIAYFDEQRPTPGRLQQFQERLFTWDDGTLKGGEYKTFSVDDDVTRIDRPVSSVVIRSLARLAKPHGVDEFAFDGPRTFEFLIDGTLPISKSVNFR